VRLRGALPPAAAAIALLVASGTLAAAAHRARDAGARAAGGTASLGAVGVAAVDVLWLRADDLFRAGRWPEMLATWEAAGRIEPRLADAWLYRGWHLAYNLAGDAARDEDRVRWVLEGVDVVDEGLHRNPESGRLRVQLAYMLLERSGRWPPVSAALAKRRGAAPLDEAIALLEPVVIRDPADPAATFLLVEGRCRRARRALVLARGKPGACAEAAADLAKAREVLASYRAAAPEGGAAAEATLTPILDALAAAAADPDPASREARLDSLDRGAR
jgi:tetratricopeptide (TPR) repeat protein